MKVLVVEDERALASALRRGLQAEGFEVDIADNGDDGLWMAQEREYDAVLLDIMLPGRNGYQICRELRDEGNWVPILMLTAKAGEFDEAEGLDTGADDYLTKPFSFVVLVARLRAMLRRGSTEQSDSLSVGDLRLDPLGHRCWRGDTEIDLTAREVSVLGYLMKQNGGTVSKRQILEHVWDYDFEGDPNIIEVYVRRLRKKLDEPFGVRSIGTVRGVGYRITADAH
jgi:two-component system OmpR family response regulator